MDLVQWIYERGDALGSALAPADSERLGIPSSGRSPPRVLARGPVLASPHLPFPLALGQEPHGTEETAAAPPSVHARLVLAGGAGHSRDPIAAEDEGHLVLGRLAEFAGVAGELLEGVGLPLSTVLPRPRELALEFVVAPIERRAAVEVTRQLLLFRAAVEIAADARGFAVARCAIVASDGGERPVNGRLNRFFLEITQ